MICSCVWPQTEMIIWWLCNLVVIWTAWDMSPMFSTFVKRSPSGTRCISGIKVSPSRNNQWHCVTPCYQDGKCWCPAWQDRIAGQHSVTVLQCDSAVWCVTVARCEHVSRDQDTEDTHASFVTIAATHPRQAATVRAESIFLSDGRFLSQKSAASRDGKYFHI